MILGWKLKCLLYIGCTMCNYQGNKHGLWTLVAIMAFGDMCYGDKLYSYCAIECGGTWYYVMRVSRARVIMKYIRND